MTQPVFENPAGAIRRVQKSMTAHVSKEVQDSIRSGTFARSFLWIEWQVSNAFGGHLASKLKFNERVNEKREEVQE